MSLGGERGLATLNGYMKITGKRRPQFAFLESRAPCCPTEYLPHPGIIQRDLLYCAKRPMPLKVLPLTFPEGAPIPPPRAKPLPTPDSPWLGSPPALPAVT